MLSGCTHHKKYQKTNSNTEELEETVARITHIPDAPFGLRLHNIVHDQIHPDNVQILYRLLKKAIIDRPDLKTFYMTNMEILGWDLVNQFESEQELLLMFVRPGNIWCLVHFDQHNVLSVVLISEKKDRF